MRSALMLIAALIGFTVATIANPQTGQLYPNLPGEVVLDNERVIVQRFITEPGQWQGVHTHGGNQVFIHLKGGEWTIRTGGRERVSHAEDGSIGWWNAVDLSQQHDVANTGDAPIEHVLVTLKPCGAVGN